MRPPIEAEVIERVANALEQVAVLRSYFPDSRIDDLGVELYARALIDLDPNDLAAGVARCVATLDRFPTVAQIRAATCDVGDRFPTAADAWGEVEKRFGDHGQRRLPRWSHWLIALAVDRMGWQRMCVSTETDVIRGQFFKAYAELAQRKGHQRQAEPFVRSLKQLPLAARLAGVLGDPDEAQEALAAPDRPGPRRLPSGPEEPARDRSRRGGR